MRVRTQLKEIASFSKGVQINGDDLIESGEYVYLNGGITPSGKWNDYNTPGGTVTISEGGNSCGYVNYMRDPFWCGAHCYYLFDTISNTEYLYYMLKSQQDRLMRIRTGACMPNIKKADLGSFELEYDTDAEKQQYVVTVLKKAEEIVAMRQQQLSALDDLIKARFVEMFGDPISNNMRLPVESMGERYTLKAGITTSADEIHDFVAGKSEIPCYGGNGIRGYVENASYDGSFPIIGRQGALCGNVQFASGRFHATEHAVLVSTRKDDDPIWTYYMLQMMDLYRFHTGAAQPGLAVKTLNTVDIIVTNKEEQKEFVAFVSQINKSKSVIQKSLDETQLLFDSLMQKYFG